MLCVVVGATVKDSTWGPPGPVGVGLGCGGLAVRVGVLVGDGLAAGPARGIFDGRGVASASGVLAGEGVALGVAVGVSVGTTRGSGVQVGVGVGVKVGVTVASPTGVAPASAVPDATSVARSGPQLARPRASATTTNGSHGVFLLMARPPFNPLVPETGVP